MAKLTPIMRSAYSSRPSPRAMDTSGAPPMPESTAKADKIIKNGKVTPMPVNASLPTSGIRPMNMRSTML